MTLQNRDFALLKTFQDSFFHCCQSAAVDDGDTCRPEPGIFFMTFAKLSYNRF